MCIKSPISDLSAGETARVLMEFLEVAVNCIVFLKGFYPPGASSTPLSFHSLASFRLFCSQCVIFAFVVLANKKKAAFERRRYMNVVVQKARHPQLADYIHSATSNLLPFVQKVLSFKKLYSMCLCYCSTYFFLSKQSFILQNTQI